MKVKDEEIGGMLEEGAGFKEVKVRERHDFSQLYTLSFSSLCYALMPMKRIKE